MNTSADPEGLVRRGNERVLRARFNDARFFWETDQTKEAGRSPARIWRTSRSRPSSARICEKTERVVELVKELGGDDAAATRRPAVPSAI